MSRFRPQPPPARSYERELLKIARAGLDELRRIRTSALVTQGLVLKIARKILAGGGPAIRIPTSYHPTVSEPEPE